MKFFILLFLSGPHLFAADCTGLQEGEVIRLDVPGKSLQNFKVYDQDGMGVCASTATSLLLQSVLPGNPALSYLQLASVHHRANLNSQKQELIDAKAEQFSLYAKKLAVQNGAVNPNQKLDDGWEVAIEGANVCGVVAQAQIFQKSSPGQGICENGKVNIEMLAGSEDPQWKQRKSILAISKYMNEFQQRFGEAATVKSNEASEKKGFWASLGDKKYTKKEMAHNEKIRTQYEQFKKAFENQLNTRQMRDAEECKKISGDFFQPLLMEMMPQLLAHTYCRETKNADNTMCSLQNKMMDVTLQTDGSYKPQLKKEFLKNLADLAGAEKASFTSEEFKGHLKKLIEKNHGKSLDSFMEMHIGKAIAAINDSLINRSLKEYNDIRKDGFSKSCAERKLLTYLSSDDFKNDAKKDEVLCKSIGLIENVGEVISSTAMNGIVDTGKIREFLLKNANLNFDEVMMDLYAQDCAASNKIQIPENITCDQFSVDVTKPLETRQKVLSELKNNRALTGTVCAEIFKKPKSQFAAGECGYHAVGITGMRCQNGKIGYLIQNSWGKTSKALNPAMENDSMEKGAYWASEESFFEGFSSLQFLGRK